MPGCAGLLSLRAPHPCSAYANHFHPDGAPVHEALYDLYWGVSRVDPLGLAQASMEGWSCWCSGRGGAVSGIRGAWDLTLATMFAFPNQGAGVSFALAGLGWWGLAPGRPVATLPQHTHCGLSWAHLCAPALAPDCCWHLVCPVAASTGRRE